MSSLFYAILTESRSRFVADGLTYASDKEIPLGTLVEVELRNTKTEGIVVAKTSDDSDYTIKPINRIVSETPLLPESQIQLLRWMSVQYFCSLRTALQIFLPGEPWAKFLPEKKRIYAIVSAKALEALKGKKQKMIAEALKGHSEMEENALVVESGAKKEILRGLVNKGILAVHDVEPECEAADTHHQRNNVEQTLLIGSPRQRLEKFKELIAAELSIGKNCIVTAPSVIDAEKLMLEMERRFGHEHVHFLHGTTPLSKRRKIFLQASRVSGKIFVGTRVALFLPVQNLSLIILDDEHDPLYKSEQTPRYHARSVAEKLAKIRGVQLILGAASPSLECWNTMKKIRSSELPVVSSVEPVLAAERDRKSREGIPLQFHKKEVNIVDLGTVNFGTAYPFSPQLLLAIDDRLKKKEQSVILLNRRGAASMLLCLDCRRMLLSPITGLPLTVHHSATASHGSQLRDNDKSILIDHATKQKYAIPVGCPHCGSVQLKVFGTGTQGAETLLKTTFPEARVGRVDAQTLDGVGLATYIAALERGEYDILIGTKPVLKTLAVPTVTLAAIAVADIGLSAPDFRAGERIFQIVAGMVSTMSDKKNSQTIIQTFRPQAPEIALGSQLKVEEYLNAELELRTKSSYPPAAEMVRLIIRGRDGKMRAENLKQHIQKMCHAEESRWSSSRRSAVRCLAPQTDTAGHLEAPPRIHLQSPLPGMPLEWRLTLIGQSLREILKKVDLIGVVVDVEPLE